MTPSYIEKEASKRDVLLVLTLPGDMSQKLNYYDISALELKEK